MTSTIDKINQISTDSDVLHAITHGPASGTASLVQTEGGPVKTISRTLQEKRDEIDAAAGAVPAITTMLGETVAARDAALIQAGVYVDEPTGRAAVADGQAFKVQGSGTVAAYEYRRVNGSSVSTLIAIYPSASYVSGVQATLDGRITNRGVVDATMVAAEVDSSGNAVSRTFSDGTKEITKLRTTQHTAAKILAQSVEHPATDMHDVFAPSYHLIEADAAGNLVRGILPDGTQYIPKLKVDALAAPGTTQSFGVDDADTIMFVGDSYTASHYTLKDKAYISVVSSLTNYRVRNFGVSGNDALDMNQRIIQATNYFDGLTYAAVKPRFAFIFAWTNDAQFVSVDLTMYQRNIERLIETVIAVGTEPILGAEFPVSPIGYAMLRNIADKYGIRFVDTSALNYELGVLKVGPFFQTHPGTRTNGVFWQAASEMIRTLPKADKSIKIYRRRAGFSVSTVADLLYTTQAERNARFKELTITHWKLADAQAAYYDELDFSGTWQYDYVTDEYLNVSSGAGVAVSDYAMVDVTLPGTARSLQSVTLTLGVPAGTQVYVRDYLDVATMPLGKAAGETPTSDDYVAKWNKPRGAWRSLGAYASTPITIPAASLKNSMRGDRMEVLLYNASGFSITACTISYTGAGGKEANIRQAKPRLSNTQLLSTPTVAATDLAAAWTVQGAPVTLVPMDNYNSPRDPANSANPIVQVCTISATDTIARTVSLPSPGLAGKRFAITAYARYFPKAFINATDPKYSGYDSAQVIDRIANPTSAPITPDTNDLRTVRLEYVFATAFPSNGGDELEEFVGLSWRAVTFYVEVPPVPMGGTDFTFRLSCPDGAVQVAKVLIQEV